MDGAKTPSLANRLPLRSIHSLVQHLPNHQTTMKKHPIQPLEKDDSGVIRFKRNAIVCHLLDHGGIDMNKLAMLHFEPEGREQFAQLIGYSLSGFSELGYVSDETYNAASRMAETDETLNQEP